MAEQSWPTMRYHPTDATPVMLTTPEELKALGPEWRDYPYSPEEVAAYAAEQASPTDEDEAEAEKPPSRSRR